MRTPTLNTPQTKTHAGRDVAPRRPQAAFAGVLALAVALGVSELVAAFVPGARSLLIAVGDMVIDLVPGWLERAVIATFGTADKPVLIFSILLVLTGIGMWAGMLARTRMSRGAGIVIVIAVVGTVAALFDPQASTAGAVAGGIAYAAAGVLSLSALLWAARRDGRIAEEAQRERVRRASIPGAPAAGTAAANHPGPGTATRRNFIAVATIATTTAGLTGMIGRRLLDDERINVIRLRIRIPRPARPAPAAPAAARLGVSGVSGVTPLYMPNAGFYRIDTALIPPQVDPARWSLKIKGLVDRPLRFSYDELMAMPHIEADITLVCVSNYVGGDLIGNARWQGVSLRALLERAGVQQGATQIVGRAIDDFTTGFPTRHALNSDDAMVALAMNGEPLPIVHGFPARLVVPGLYGYVSATKWLAEIELTRWEDFNAYWVPRGWAKEAPVKTQSRIDVPRSGTSLKAGRQPVAGVAWAPTRGIQRVEVRIDNGPWQQADLAAAINSDTWRQWILPWDATPGPHTISVRATDGEGATQTAVRSALQPNGSTGHHTIKVVAR